MNILELNHEDAKDFFLKGENYFSLELPKYFKFSDLLRAVSEKLGTHNLSNYYSNCKACRPESFEDVNYKILNNKNGEYAWRLFQLIHPALYVAIVHEITKEKNWESIVERFGKFQRGIVECTSLPVIKAEKDKSGKATQISTWWEKVEQKSLALSLEYEYLFHTDIVDCYGSIYTHSIAWALHTKEKAKENRNNQNFLGNVIDKKLREMQNGQTNGIPQGSVLMDFIAEMVLGYTDQELSDKLKGISKEEYKIIRYRDDYRVFVNNPETGKEIIKELTNVLSEMGMRLNTEKTKCSDDVILGSIKPDKLFWITHRSIKRNLEKNLLIIYDVSKKYPNSGTLMTELQRFYKKIEKRKELKNLDILIGISVNIAFKNPRTYSVVSAILSKLLELSENSAEIMDKIIKRFTKLPNTEHLDLWLQRITLKIEGDFSYQGKLCKRVEDNNVEIWCSDWLKDDFKKIISSGVIIDQKEIDEMKPVIESEEVDIFKRYY